MAARSAPHAHAHDPFPVAHPSFVLQKHWGGTVHYDLRLEVAGRLVSWAVLKGPSMDPTVHRLAIRTPDHELTFGRFEGNIPEGRYGAGTVMVWDLGTYDPLRPKGMSEEAWLSRGKLKVRLEGERVRGLFRLVHWQRGSSSPETWLLVKVQDRHAVHGFHVEPEDRSALTGRTYREISGAMSEVPRRRLEEWDGSGLPASAQGAP